MVELLIYLVDPWVSITSMSMAFINELPGQTSQSLLRRHTVVPLMRCTYLVPLVMVQVVLWRELYLFQFIEFWP
jgi:hypothetical protein